MSNSEMVDETNNGPQLNCAWCKTAIGQTNHHSYSVCKKCYGLLSGAGINRSEIFAPLDPPSSTSSQR